MKGAIALLASLTLLLLIAPVSVLAGDDDLREEVKALRDRVKELEQRLGGAELEVLGTDGVSQAIDELVAANVTAPGSQKLRITGQVRIQAENHLDSDFDDDAGDAKEYVYLRTRVMFDAQILEWLRAFVKIQDSRAFGEEHSVLADMGGADLKEGYADFLNLFGLPLMLRIGRQEMKYGDQRLVSNLDWHPVGRSWDGFRLMYDGESFHSHLIITRIDERFLAGGHDESEDFLGLYNWLEVDEDHVLDFYVFFRRNQDRDEIIGEDGTGGHEKLWTLGARFKGRYEGFDYVAEGVYQFGDYASDDISAYMFELGLGYTWMSSDLKPRIGLSWIFASGDDDPLDEDRNTYDPLYTFGHSYLGYMDFVNRQNISSPKLSIRVSPSNTVTISLDGHLFWVDESEDALYALSGKPRRAGDSTGDADDDVGAEIDLHMKVKITKSLVIWGGYSHFFAGEFLDDTGSDDGADFFFVQMTVNF